MTLKRDDPRVMRMKEKIRTEPHAAFKVLATIWDRQSEGEKFTHRYDQREGGKSRGFSPDHTKPMNELYERYEAAGNRWQDLTPIDVVRCQRVMPFYAWQYLTAEAERREAEAEASRQWLEEGGRIMREKQRARSAERWGPEAVID